MPKPSLHLGNVGPVVEGVGGGGGSQAMWAELGGNPGGLRILPEHPVINGCRGKGFIRIAITTWIFHRPEESTVHVLAVAGHRQVKVDGLQGRWVSGDVAGFVPLAPDPQMDHPLALVHVLRSELEEFIEPQAVKKEGCQIARSLSPLRVSEGGVARSTRAWSSLMAGVFPSFMSAFGRRTPSTGLVAMAFFSHK